MVAPPLDSPCDGPVTYPGDIKTLIKSSKEEADRRSNTYRGWTQTEYQNKPYNINQKDEGT